MPLSPPHSSSSPPALAIAIAMFPYHLSSLHRGWCAATVVRHLSTETTHQSLHIVTLAHLLCSQPPLPSPLSPLSPPLLHRGWSIVTTMHSRSPESARQSLHVIPLVSFPLAFAVPDFCKCKWPGFKLSPFGGIPKEQEGQGESSNPVTVLLALTQIWSRMLRSRNSYFFLVQARGTAKVVPGGLTQT